MAGATRAALLGLVRPGSIWLQEKAAREPALVRASDSIIEETWYCAGLCSQGACESAVAGLLSKSSRMVEYFGFWPAAFGVLAA